jgi:hypothetical protein
VGGGEKMENKTAETIYIQEGLISDSLDQKKENKMSENTLDPEVMEFEKKFKSAEEKLIEEMDRDLRNAAAFGKLFDKIFEPLKFQESEDEVEMWRRRD